MEEKFNYSGSEIEEFREMIKNMQEDERSGKNKTKRSLATPYSIDDSIDVSKLTEEDMKIWQKLEDDTLTTDEFFKYQGSLEGDDRHKFAALVANLLGRKEAERTLEEMKKGEE